MRASRPAATNAARMLWDTATRDGLATAIVDGDERVTYDGLRQRAASVAGALAAAGVTRGQRVGILLQRGANAAAALFGTLAVGGVAVLMDDVLRPRQVEYTLGHSGATCLITSEPILARHPRTLVADAEILNVDAMVSAGGDFAPVALPATTTAQIVYTSGSTGEPKGVMVSHVNLEALTSVVNGYLGLAHTDRVAGLLPFSFVYGLGQLLCAVRSGATLVVERSPLASQVAATVAQQEVTVLAGVPALWTRLLAAPAFRDAPIASLRVLTNAGGALNGMTVAALRQSQPHARLFLMYGLTEALRCTYLPPEEVDAHPASMGRAIPGGEVLLLRDDGTEAAPGEAGELVYGGPTVTQGYWQDGEATARVFRSLPALPGRDPSDRWVFTGDLARRDEQGLLYYVGRRDRMIKTMGYRVSPHEVASVLHASGEITDAEVVGEPDAQWGMTLLAHVVLRPHGSLERLREYCNRELPRYLRPSRFVVRDAMPLTANGKHDLAALASSGSVR